MPCSLHCLFLLGIQGALVLLPSVVKPVWCEQWRYFSNPPKADVQFHLFCTVSECRNFLKPSTAFIWAKVQWPFLIGRDQTPCCNLPAPWHRWSQIPGYRSIAPPRSSWTAPAWRCGGDHAISLGSAIKRRAPGGDTPTNILHLPHHAHSHTMLKLIQGVYMGHRFLKKIGSLLFLLFETSWSVKL